MPRATKTSRKRTAPATRRSRRHSVAAVKTPSKRRQSVAAQKYMINHFTGRKIKVNGPTHRKLMAVHGGYEGSAQAKQEERDDERYGAIPLDDFCGPAGGEHTARSFPINTPGRAHNALSRRHFAPNPEGIANCVYTKSARKCAEGQTGYCGIVRK